MNRFEIPEPAARARDVFGYPPLKGAKVAGLNLGCGQRFHSAWSNLDLKPADSSIRRWDVSQHLPFQDASFPAVYHSHLLQHLPREQALPFLRECRRVLQPAGILRLAVPNLEAIARLYLHTLEAASHGEPEAIAEHGWMVMELLDRSTRECPGGAMEEYLQNEDSELARYRLGVDGEKSTEFRSPPPSFAWREQMLRWLLGEEYALLQLGRFRRAGEVYHWMYDRVSLRELLRTAGFEFIRCVGPMESEIPHWNEYHLDTTPEGDVRKPDSLFVEAERP